MNTARFLAASALIAMLAVMLPRVGWVAFDTYILDNPDDKLGANAGVMIVAVLGALCGLIAGVVVAIFAAAALAVRHRLDHRAVLYSAVFGGLVLSWLSSYVFHLPSWAYETALGEIGGMVVSWALVCAAISAVTYLVARAFGRGAAKPKGIGS
jgi:uncharacterized YccA/Bax inhibitor family protein